MSHWLNNFVAIYNNLGKDNLDNLEKIYHPKVCFVDPVHKIQGLPQLKRYFEHMYQNLISCDFKLLDSIQGLDDGEDQEVAIYWKMTLQHRKIKGGEAITVEGHSRLRRHQEKIIYHRDYFDLGAMVYQHLPVLGGLIRLINRKISD